MLFKEWGEYREIPLEYPHGDDWERLLRQGIGLLEQFAEITASGFANPNKTCRRKFPSLSNGNEFVAYVDAIGYWTAPGVCWNGKPRVPVIRSPKDYID